MNQMHRSITAIFTAEGILQFSETFLLPLDTIQGMEGNRLKVINYSNFHQRLQGAPCQVTHHQRRGIIVPIEPLSNQVDDHIILLMCTSHLMTEWHCKYGNRPCVAAKY